MPYSAFALISEDLHMIFSSYRFIFAFFPIVFGGYTILRLLKKPLLTKIWLVLASLAFYAFGQLDFFPIFLGTIIFNYACVYFMHRFEDKHPLHVLFFLLSVFENIGLLLYYKYTNFFIDNINRIAKTDIQFLNLILPIGISFFTFQILAYSVSVFKDKLKPANPLDYSLFITFFPQLVVGPIVMHEEILPQIRDSELIAFDKNNVIRGILLFSIGAAKKIIIANPLITYAQNYYFGGFNEGGTTAAWFGMLAFTFAYYFDFSGYIDMARGIGYLFGIKLPINFNSPYKAESFADFWRRWNMTVSGFFDKTVFASLFGFGDGFVKLFFATVITFLVSGLWHGSAWHFVAWGLFNGILVAISNILTLHGFRMKKAIGCSVTFIVMMLGRVLFDARNTGEALLIYKKLFSFTDPLQNIGSFVSENAYTAVLLILSALICFCFKNSNEICDGEDKVFGVRHAIAAAFLLVLALVNMSSVSTFLYFSF